MKRTSFVAATVLLLVAGSGSAADLPAESHQDFAGCLGAVAPDSIAREGTDKVGVSTTVKGIVTAQLSDDWCPAASSRAALDLRPVWQFIEELLNHGSPWCLSIDEHACDRG